MRRLLLLLCLLALARPAAAAVIETFPASGAARDKTVALTFDACETITPSHFDQVVLGELLAERLPATLFISGKFARRNAEEIARLAALPQFRIENHSTAHDLHMERLPLDDARRDVADNGRLLAEITGRQPRFFRFPGGNYDAPTLAAVEGLGYRVVHWTFPSGDPDPHLTPERLTEHVLNRTKPGSILIFHINGRGYATGKALPGIIAGLRKKGYRFVSLEEALGK